MTNFPLKEKISYNYKEKQFSKQKIPYTCAKKLNASSQMCFESGRAIVYASKI